MHTCNGTPSSLSSEEVNITEISLYPKEYIPPQFIHHRVAIANFQNIFQVSSLLYFMLGLPWCLTNKESTFNTGDAGSVPGLGRFPGGGNGNPFQYGCLENPINKEAWQATVQGLQKSQTRLSN